MIPFIIETEIIAVRIWIDNRNVCIRLADDGEIRFPVSKNNRLAKATDEQLEDMELICGGTGIHWNQLDEDLSISGILLSRLD